MSKTLKTKLTSAFTTWAHAEERDLEIVRPGNETKPGTTSCLFHENGLVTIKLWGHDASAVEEVTLPGSQVLALIGGAK